MEWLASPEAWVALATLTLLEIVLGIDNIIFIAILVGRLPEAQRQRARLIGLGLAMATRIMLLLLLAWIMRLKTTLVSFAGLDLSGRDFILIGGGLFLLAKSTLEIHHSLEGPEDGEQGGAAGVTFLSVLVQIAMLDVVFSLDSVITAVGMVDQVEIMIAAIMIAVGVMMFAAQSISEFVDSHPTIKMLALSFLVLIGVALIGEGFDFHIPKGYIYFAMAFSVSVELLNLKIRRRSARPLELRKRLDDD
ncbi:MAG: TerC family protein [Gammaproteobacteria bacterium]|nr:TerC family protein [Gammaproteobacteria bacterium]